MCAYTVHTQHVSSCLLPGPVHLQLTAAQCSIELSVCSSSVCSSRSHYAQQHVVPHSSDGRQCGAGRGRPVPARLQQSRYTTAATVENTLLPSSGGAAQQQTLRLQLGLLGIIWGPMGFLGNLLFDYRSPRTPGL